MWLLTLALAAIPLGAGFAQASGGGVAPPSSEPEPSEYQRTAFGSRNLSMGMSGDDVMTLNWLLKGLAASAGARAAGPVPLNGRFEQPTHQSVRSLQDAAGFNADGVVRKGVRMRLLKQMKLRGATWYGPGLWGNRTACGQTLRPGTIGVAHKTLPCGTRVAFSYKGRWARARVIDRGPYNPGHHWDLTKRVANQLGFLATGAGKIRVAVVR